MSNSILIFVIDTIANLILLVLFLQFIVQFFLSPFHPFRETLDRILDPMLNPIRQIIPPAGGWDFSPIILWILVILIKNLLVSSF
jgi:YggT family protein